MVFPLGMEMAQPPIPESIKSTYAKYWWFLTFLFFVMSIVTMVSGDILGGILVLLITIICFILVRNDCEQMTQPCILMFGLLCFIQSIFEIITLAINVGGRKEEKTTREEVDEGGTTRTTYTTTVEEHPFFCDEMGWQYNLQSWKMIILPCVLLLAVILCYLTYQQYPDSFFDDGPRDRRETSYYRGGGYDYGSRDYGSRDYRDRPSSGYRYQREPELYSGTGHTLGS